MPNLKIRFLRDNMSRIVGSVVEGYADGSKQVRNRYGQIVGKLEPGVGTKTQDNRIISRSQEVGFLFGFSEENDE